MKKMTDEELQEWLDKSRDSSVDKHIELTGNDATAYKVLFKVLDNELHQGLPYDFSAKVTRRVQAELKRSSELRYYLISIVAVAATVFAIYGLLVLLKPLTGKIFFNELAEYKWAFVLCIFSFLTIQYLDQVLIKTNIFRRSGKQG